MSKSSVELNDTIQTTITSFDDKIAQFRVLWTIHDYQGIKDVVRQNEFVASTKSFSMFDNGLRYQLRVYPKGESQSTVSVYVVPSGSEDVKTWMNFLIAIVDNIGGYQHPNISTIIEVGSKGRGFTDCFPVDISSELLPNNSLQILFEGTMWSEEPQFNEDKHVYDWMKKGSSVMADPQFLYANNIPKESKVTVKHGTFFNVSKSFLCSRSDVFHNKFSSVSDNNIKIPSVTEQVFRVILCFLCTNTILTTVNTMLPEVIKFASEFELSYLMEICQIKMIQNLKEQNALEYFRIANEIKAKKLKKKCLDFIVENGASISAQPSFREFKAQYSEIADLLDRLMIGNRPVINF